MGPDNPGEEEVNVDDIVREELKKVLNGVDLDLAMAILESYKRGGARGVKELIRKKLREIGIDVDVE